MNDAIRHRRSARWIRAWVLLGIAAAMLVSLAVMPASAGAHAELLGTEPANEATVTEHPSEVTITFNENVTAPFGAVKVYGPDGERVERGSAKAVGEVVSVPIDADAAGTFAVAWRATSADGHPVRGAFVFHVEETSDDSVSRDAALEASAGSRSKDIAFGIARIGILLGVLVVVGGVLFSALTAGEWRPKWLRGSFIIAFVSMLFAYVLDASIAAGLSLIDTLDPAVLREQATTVYGRATLVRIIVLVACVASTLVIASERWKLPIWRFVVTLQLIVLAATLSISGHAMGDSVTVLRLPMDMLHSIAAAAWLGGLVQLVPWSRITPVNAAVFDRWTKLALASVVTLVATGAWAAGEEIGLSFDGLTSTTYGRLVLLKLILLFLALPLANLNRLRVVPAVKAAAPDAESRLRRYVRMEIWIIVFVLIATAWLIQTPPARTQMAPPFVEQTITLDSGSSVQLVLDPAAAGSNEVHVYAFDGQMQVDESVTGMTLTAHNEERGLGPLDIELLKVGPAHFTSSSATIPFAGEWEFDVAVTRGRFDEERTRFSADIAPSKPE